MKASLSAKPFSLPLDSEKASQKNLEQEARSSQQMSSRRYILPEDSDEDPEGDTKANNYYDDDFDT